MSQNPDTLVSRIRSSLRAWQIFPNAVSAGLFLRLLALIYAIAFASLWVQIDGLIGSRGILPASNTLTLVQDQLGASGIWRFPTLFWFSASDGALHTACFAGVVLALFAAVCPGVWPCWLFLWLGYLSFSTVGRDFLSFQWDALLLETGCLTLFLVPFRACRHPLKTPDPHPLIAWLYRFLLFRLMFASGVVKLASGDPTWRNLTALTYHYETQPLPNPISWYAHQLPKGFQELSCAGVFVIELILPVLIFGPRRLRLTACAGLVMLQLLIFATGNYTFFNLLTLALCLWLIDDDAWPSKIKRILPTALDRSMRNRLCVPFAALVVLLSAYLFTRGTVRMSIYWPEPVPALYRLIAPFQVVNSYGLFAVMTTERREIVLEGSADGQTWSPYAFYDKPGDLSRSLPFVAPYQPRLDWQMWFAALGTARQTPWFIAFCRKILQGSPPVLSLLAHNPFPTHPPAFFRARLYRYEFTTPEERRHTGHIWKRTLLGDYLPALKNPYFTRNKTG